MGAYDGYKYAKKKKLKGWKKAAAIAGGAALGAVNPFKVVKAAKKVVKAAKYTKKALSNTKKLKAASKAVKKVKTTKVKKAKYKAKTVTVKTKKAKNTTAKKKKTATGKCFVAGTKISTEKGFTPIEQIKPGDYVWSEDPATNEKALKKVKKIFVREKDSIIRLSINGEVIETTREHPFYVEGVGFIAAGELKASDEVRLQSDEAGVVDYIEEVSLDEPIKVYNFEVEDFHTYYVSEQKVLVHNTCPEDVPETSVHIGKSGEQIYLVGAYKNIKGTIEGTQAHHVGQKALMSKLISGYNAQTAPAITVPIKGHTEKGPRGFVSRQINNNLSPRQLLARDIRELRRVYPDIPNSALQELILINKKMYVEMLK